VAAVGVEDGAVVAGGGRVGSAWFGAIRLEAGAVLPEKGEEAPELGEEAGGGLVALDGCMDGFALMGRSCGERWEHDDEGNEGDQGEDGDAETLGASGHGGPPGAARLRPEWLGWADLQEVSVRLGGGWGAEDEDRGSFLPGQS